MNSNDISPFHPRRGTIPVFRNQPAGVEMALVIENGTIVTSTSVFKGDILVLRGKIAAIGTGLYRHQPGTARVDATDRYVIPGAVDGHTHLDMPLGDIRSSDDVESGTRAALFGGTTCVVDYANQTRGHSLKEALDQWSDRATGKACCDYGFHMTICDPTPETISEIPLMLRSGISSFKTFFAYPGRLMIDDRAFLSILAESSRRGFLVNLHAENGHLVEHATRRLLEKGDSATRFHPEAHPREAELEAVQRAICLLQANGGTLNIVHVSCMESLDRIAIAKRAGMRILAETCPQYLLLTEQLYRRPAPEAVKWVMSPPLRTRADNRALWQAMGSGTIDTIGTDHCPFLLEQKSRNLDQFDRIPNGAPGIEDRVELLFSNGVLKNRITLNQWVRLIATHPARIYGLYPKKGDLMPGSDADIVIFNPHHRHIISSATRHMKVDYNSYAGLEITGRVEQVFVRGHEVVKDGSLLVEPGFGQFIRRGRPILP